MSTFLSNNDWAEFNADINAFSDDVSKGSIRWLKWIGVIPKHGDDTDLVGFDNPVDLFCFFQYNSFRTWPMTGYTQTGEEDKQSELCFINMQYLNGLGLLDGSGKFIYNPDKDRFIHRGRLYYDSGQTEIADAPDGALFHILILKRVDMDNINAPID